MNLTYAIDGANKVQPMCVPRTVSRAIAKDAAWFARRPHRTLRLRKPAAAEDRTLSQDGMPLPQSAGGCPLRIVVIQIRPGIRARGALWTNLDVSTPEEVLKAAIRLFQAAVDQGWNGVIGRDELALAMGLNLVTKH